MSDATPVVDEESDIDVFSSDEAPFDAPTSESDEQQTETEQQDDVQPEAAEESQPEQEAESEAQSEGESDWARVRIKHNKEEQELDVRAILSDPAKRDEFISKIQKGEDYDRIREAREKARAELEELQRLHVQREEQQRQHLINIGVLRRDPVTGNYSYATPQQAPQKSPEEQRFEELDKKARSMMQGGESLDAQEWAEYSYLKSQEDRKAILAEVQKGWQEREQRAQVEALQRQLAQQVEDSIASHKDAFELAGEKADSLRSQARQAALIAVQQAGGRANAQTIPNAIENFAKMLTLVAAQAQARVVQKSKTAAPKKKAPPAVTGARAPAGGADEKEYKSLDEAAAAATEYLSSLGI